MEYNAIQLFSSDFPVLSCLVLEFTAATALGSHLDHSPWNGFCLADIVMPAFLFMVGVSVPLALRKYARPSRQHKDQNHKQSVAKAWAKVGTRTIKLFGIG